MKRVLLIEDEIKDKSTYPLISDIKEAGYELDVAETGNETVEKLSQTKYDGIIFDLMIKHGNGTKVSLEIPKHKVGRHILQRIIDGEFEGIGNNKTTPVIIVTAVIDYEEERALKGMLINKEWYLKKPIRPDLIVNTLKQALETPRG